MNKPIVLYSTNTWLAFAIAERYYRSVHYCWCSPVFDSRKQTTHVSKNPPTASPAEILERLAEDVDRVDLHSPRIQENKMGILAGATAKFQSGIIGRREKTEIARIVGSSQVTDFRPLLFVIPVAKGIRIVNVPVGAKAHPLSEEYLVRKLGRRLFDVIEVGPAR